MRLLSDTGPSSSSNHYPGGCWGYTSWETLSSTSLCWIRIWSCAAYTGRRPCCDHRLRIWSSSCDTYRTPGHTNILPLVSCLYDQGSIAAILTMEERLRAAGLCSLKSTLSLG